MVADTIIKEINQRIGSIVRVIRRAGHVNPQYDCGFGRILIKHHLTGNKSRLIFNSTINRSGVLPVNMRLKTIVDTTRKTTSSNS